LFDEQVNTDQLVFVILAIRLTWIWST